MKTSIFKYSLGLLFVILFAACSKKDAPVVNEFEGLKLVKTFKGTNHTIDLYTNTGSFQTGYNTAYFQIKKLDGTIAQNITNTSLLPIMNMMNMSHSCPVSAIGLKENSSSIYKGYIVFQMASNDMEYWELNFNYTIGNDTFKVADRITVNAAPKRVVESFQGSDSARYIIALAEPTNPRVAINDISAVVYKMESMMKFTTVDNFKVNIDPRMPGMNNHSSPNNEDLVQGTDKLYHGKLSLTMTGYWKINLQLENETGSIVKGEPVTESNEGSSIFFEIEF